MEENLDNPPTIGALEIKSSEFTKQESRSQVWFDVLWLFNAEFLSDVLN